MDASATIPQLLLGWYRAHARALPWRVLPGEGGADPYRVWLSEVMLQQTTVAAVGPYFERFIARWPSVEALSAAPEGEVMAAWAGLGYYSRARNLVSCAREVAARGAFPESEEQLRELPGLGPYTAAAIAAIAFGKRAVVVDANVERVVARLFAIEEPLPGAKEAIRAAADAITPDKDAGDFAQAMMDLGATVCAARDPKCLLCPLGNLCEGRKKGDPARLPVKAPKKAKPERVGNAYWIEREGRVWLVRRPGQGMLGAMRALPDDGWNARSDGSGEPPLAGEWRNAGAVRHSFTHFHITLSLHAHQGEAAEPAGEGEWWEIEQLGDAGLPTLFAKVARMALA
jgi:A/G-specific adenine glycosylase